jgi:hypothetical protein
MKAKLLPESKCKVAGKTSDGKICYYGKKDTDRPDAEDLSLWVTLGRPRSDGSNYTRLSKVGYDEAKMFKEAGNVPVREIVVWRDRHVVTFLSSVHSSELKKRKMEVEA